MFFTRKKSNQDVALPLIDTAVPSELETATFAMG